MLPIAGATVDPLCMGLSPYATNVYHTDAQGAARVMFYKTFPLVVARIEKDGYETNFATIQPTNPVASLKKRQ